MAVSTITASPAAGPLTPRAEPLAAPTTMPPTMPAIRPEASGAPDASAMPRHSGTATRKTTRLAGRSDESRLTSVRSIRTALLLNNDQGRIEESKGNEK